jgi:hypothetical protein
LYSKTEDVVHQGVVLGWKKIENINNLLLLVTTKTGVEAREIEYLNGEFDTKNSFVGPAESQGGGIIGIDLDDDGEGEYVISSGKKFEPFLFYYNSKGVLLTQFWAYDTSYRAGLVMSAMDFDLDGKNDLAVVGADGLTPVRFWNYKAKKIGEWELTDKLKNDFKIFGL